jgi:hypothetical protein
VYAIVLCSVPLCARLRPNSATQSVGCECAGLERRRRRRRSHSHPNPHPSKCHPNHVLMKPKRTHTHTHIITQPTSHHTQTHSHTFGCRLALLATELHTQPLTARCAQQQFVLCCIQRIIHHNRSRRGGGGRGDGLKPLNSRRALQVGAESRGGGGGGEGWAQMELSADERPSASHHMRCAVWSGGGRGGGGGASESEAEHESAEFELQRTSGRFGPPQTLNSHERVKGEGGRWEAVEVSEAQAKAMRFRWKPVGARTG